jgi:hypothetical protein
MRGRCFLAGAILLVAVLLSGWSGQRYIEVHVEREGALVLKTEYGVSDRMSTAAIWRGLRSDSFDTVGTIEPQKDDALKAVLRGKIRIVILHVNNPIAAANVDELKLVRGTDSSTQWQLAPGEVQRTAKIAGL